VLDFLSSTDEWRRAPAEEEDAVSTVSEHGVGEWLEQQGAEAEELGGGETATVPSHARLQGGCRRGLAAGGHPFLSLLPLPI